MPSASLDFRAKCGLFVLVFNGFMYRRAVMKMSMRVRVLKVRNRATGVMVGLILAVFFFEELLLRCGDIEANPGPPKRDPTKQTQLITTRRCSSVDENTLPKERAASVSDSVIGEPSLRDVMTMLTTLTAKFDEMKADLKDLKYSHEHIKTEMQDVKTIITDLVSENESLKRENKLLSTRLDELEKKADDLECRSKRNNLMFYGLPRPDRETPQECEDTVRELLTDKLDITSDVQFDRVHRLSGKADYPIVARCTFYKDKVKILREKRKLKGSNVFVGEDFSNRVREVRKRLANHLKDVRAQGKRATMVFDHLLVDGKKFFLGKDEKLKEYT